MDTNTDPAPDPYEGVGGCYVRDPLTGRRIQVVAPPDRPQPAPAPTPPVASVSAEPSPATASPAVETSALDPAGADKSSPP